jgi:N6-L-threonylcarbamoyladenine synthase
MSTALAATPPGAAVALGVAAEPPGAESPGVAAVHYRPMAMADTPAAAELEARCFEASALSGERWSESAFRAELFASDRIWWVAWAADELIGLAGGALIDGDLQVLDLAVDARHRRQGVASALIGRLLGDARALGAATASLEVRPSNAAAIRLYLGIGFTEQGRRPGYYTASASQPAEDALVLSLRLDGPGLRQGGAGQMQAQADGTEATAGIMHQHPLILAIETSCDETAAAVIDGQGRLVANVVASQVDYHSRFGGVVPEIASRKHTEAIVGVVDEACAQAGLSCWGDLDGLAVTYAPGLIGALVVGVAFAKGLSWATGLPLSRVNHLEGHIYASRLGVAQAAAAGAAVPASPAAAAPARAASLAILPEPQPPFVIALLSGGHTMLVEVQGWAKYRVMGQTLDDAVGEAFDKVAKALGLGYPGGPAISRLASEGDPAAIDFPRAMLRSGDLSFSLSGLKTAVITYIRQQQADGLEVSLADVAASFQQAVIDVQVAKALTACREAGVDTFCLGGGVAANRELREAYRQALGQAGIKVYFPPLEACSDNAAMIAAVALDRYSRGLFMPLDGDAQASSDLSLGY